MRKSSMWVGVFAVSAVIFSSTIVSAAESERDEKSVQVATSQFTGMDRLANEDPTFAPQVFRLAAQSYMRRGKAAEAVDVYQKALDTNPSDTGILQDMAEAQLAAGQNKEALKTWETILAGGPDDSSYKMEYASFLIRAGQGDKAVEMGREMAAKRPKDASLRYWISDAYLRQEKNHEAAEELRGMLKDFPDEATEIQRRLTQVTASEAAHAEKPAATPKAEAPTQASTTVEDPDTAPSTEKPAETASPTDKPEKKKGMGWFFKKKT